MRTRVSFIRVVMVLTISVFIWFVPNIAIAHCDTLEGPVVAAAKETKKHADESVEAGRKFVEAYVEFTHYVERLYMDATGKTQHHEE
ncbi:MAG: DUF6448 family protein, partial [Thermodesulfovibrionales bacterium]